LLLSAIPLLAQGQDDNTLYINDTLAVANSEVTLSVKMRNSVYAEGFAFDLLLPLGMTVVTDADGTPAATLTEERTTARRTDTFGAAVLNAYLYSAVRVIAASSNGSAIPPGDGEVCTVTIRVPAGMSEGIYQLTMRNISISDTDAHSHDVTQMVSKIEVQDHWLGDANDDGRVTVADLVAIAHHLLGHTPAVFSFKGADANRDEVVNVADYVAVAHFLGEDPTLSQGGFPRMPPVVLQPPLCPMAAPPLCPMAAPPLCPMAAPPLCPMAAPPLCPMAAPLLCSMVLPSKADASQPANSVYIAPAKVCAGGEALLSVRMRNAVDAEGLQFTLTLPQGVSVVRDADGLPDVRLSNDRTTPERTNTFATSVLPDGTLKVMAASTKGAAIAAGDGEVCTVRVQATADIAQGDYPLLLSDVAISDTHAKSCDVAHEEATLTVDEVSAIDDARLSPFTSHPLPLSSHPSSLTSHPIPQTYDLQGRRLHRQPSGEKGQQKGGIYIREGRKYVGKRPAPYK